MTTPSVKLVDDRFVMLPATRPALKCAEPVMAGAGETSSVAKPRSVKAVIAGNVIVRVAVLTWTEPRAPFGPEK